jgi:hypothetical protein
MYIMYVDESGDPGSANGSSEYFILSGLILHYKSWYKKLDLLKRMRKYFKKKYGLPLTTEIHAKELLRISHLKLYRKISKPQRVRLLKEYASFIPKMFKDCWIINICLHKKNFPAGTDFTTLAFNRLITRYNMFLAKTVKDEGVIISDESNETPLRNLLRKMRVYNPIQSRYSNKAYNARITKVIEDIVHRQSSTSYFIQTVDIIAYLLKNKEYPKGGAKKYNLDLLFDLLDPILLKTASIKDPQGIVRQ